MIKDLTWSIVKLLSLEQDQLGQPTKNTSSVQEKLTALLVGHPKADSSFADEVTFHVAYRI